MMYCPTCQQPCRDDTELCPHCYTSLKRVSCEGALSPGTLLHYRYNITKLIKAGGMGAVYLVKDIKTNKTKALKELLKQLSSEEEHQYLVQRFKEEADLLSKLRFPNIPRVTDYFLDYDNYYLVMDYIEGSDLETILEKEGNPGVSEDRVADWALQICMVLNYIHNQDPVILYRDLKPSNIMLRHSDNTAMLIDFGLARTIQPGSSKAKTAIGTEGYSPPEQYMGMPEPRSDIYALGVTMHHLLTGQFPSVPFQLANVRELSPNVSEEMEAIVMTAVQIDANQRFDSAEEMYQTLLDIYPELEKRVDYLFSIELDDEVVTQGVETVILGESEKEFYTEIIEEDKKKPSIEIPPVIEEKKEIIPKTSYAPPIMREEDKSEDDYLIDELDKDIADIEMELDGGISLMSPYYETSFPTTLEVTKEVKPEPYYETSFPTNLEITKEVKPEPYYETSFPTNLEITKEVLPSCDTTLLPKKFSPGKLRQEMDREDRFISLVKDLTSNDMSVKENAVIGLSELGDKRAVTYLLELLEYKDEELIKPIMEALGTLNDPLAIPTLSKIIEEPDLEMRQRSALALGDIKDEQSLKVLLKAIVQSDVNTRGVAAYALGNLGNRDAIPGLIEAFLEDTDIDVRTYSAESIIQLDGRTEIKKITEFTDCSDNERKKLVSRFFPEYFASKSGKTQSFLYKESIEDKIKPYILKLKDDDWRVRKDACQSLGNMRIPETVTYLIQALKDKNEQVCRAAGYALARFPDSVKSLIPLLSYPRQMTVEMAIFALGELKAYDAVPFLIDLLKEAKWDIKGKIASTLAEIGDINSLSSLAELFLDDSLELRVCAAEAISKIDKDNKAISKIIKIANSEDKKLRQKYIINLYPDLPVSKKLRSFLEEDEKSKIPIEKDIKTDEPFVLSARKVAKPEVVPEEPFVLGKRTMKQEELQIEDPLELATSRKVKDEDPFELATSKKIKDEDPFTLGVKTDVDFSIGSHKKIEPVVDRTENKLPLKETGKNPDTILSSEIELENLIIKEQPVINMEKPEKDMFLDDIKDMYTGNSETRKTKIIFIGDKYKEKSLEDLTGIFLNDNDGIVREAAFSALSGINKDLFTNKLISSLNNSSSLIQQRVIQGLELLKAFEGVPAIIECLRSGEPHIRSMAATSLGNIGDKRAVQDLCNSLLKDPDSNVRQASVEALEKIGDKSLTGELLKALKQEKNSELRKIIARVLSKLRF